MTSSASSTNMVRTLDVLLSRIIFRETRMRVMLNRQMTKAIVDQEREVLDGMILEYTKRVNRLNMYMGLT